MADTVTIPPYINAQGLLPLLSLLGTVDASRQIVVDFSLLRRVTPAALTAIAAHVTRWKREGTEVTFEGLDACPISGYLRRMDLFSACGMEEAEEGSLREAGVGKFVPVRAITHIIPTPWEAK